MFKIRINCTTKDDLSFCGRKINKKIHNQLVQKLTPNDDIEIIQILYKTHRKPRKPRKPKYYTRITLEFFTNNELCDKKFISFIANMKSLGFISESDDCCIQLINTISNDILLNYYFTSEIKHTQMTDDIHYKNTSKT